MQTGWELNRLILGIRHTRIFKISDVLGDIIDKAITLQGTGSFPKGCFTQVERPDGMSIVLKNDEDTLSLNCNIDGVILESDMQAERYNDKKTIQEMFLKILNLVLPFSEGKNKINRIGIVHQYSCLNEKACQKIFSDYLKFDLGGTPDNIAIRFALKNPSFEALAVLSKKSDYKNLIIEINSNKKEDSESDSPQNMIKMSIDYQMYFEPLRKLNDIKIDEHMSAADSYIKKML